MDHVQLIYNRFHAFKMGVSYPQSHMHHALPKQEVTSPMMWFNHTCHEYIIPICSVINPRHACAGGLQ